MNWSHRYRIGDTPWEKGEAHPALPFLLSLFPGLFTAGKSVLVPGCGLGHDLGLMVRYGLLPVGLDVAEEALQQARGRYPDSKMTWLCDDLFMWAEHTQERFPLVWEHTCFCAIPVEFRENYAKALARVTETHGHLVGVYFLYPDQDPEKGPPYGVTRDELSQLFTPWFELLWDLPPRQTYRGRERQETVIMWRRRRRAPV